MRTIYKYALTDSDFQMIQMPEGAKPLAVQLQDGLPMLWAEVDPERPLVAQDIKIVGTGQTSDGNMFQYIGTFQKPPYVWHVYGIFR